MRKNPNMTQVAVCLHNDTLQALDRLKERTGMTHAELIRHAVNEAETKERHGWYIPTYDKPQGRRDRIWMQS